MRFNSLLSVHGLSALLAFGALDCSQLEEFIGNDNRPLPVPAGKDSPERREAVGIASPSVSSLPVPVPSVRKFSALSDDERRATLFDVVKELAGKYAFPVPHAQPRARLDALSIGRTYYEFGAERGSAANRHRGVDIYSFGETVVSFADGTVAALGRHKYKFDFGNIIILRHDPVQGHELHTYYMHIGAVSDQLAVGRHVRQGEPLARVDCTGISDNQWRPYFGTARCRPKGHLHFQVRLDDMHVNPDFFFPDYASAALPNLRSHRLAIAAQDIGDRIFPFTERQALGSYAAPVAHSKSLSQ